eukprot:6576639-Prorocentrum_lima.AAC.1
MDTEAVSGSSRSQTQNAARFPGCTAADFEGKKASTHSMLVIGGFRQQKIVLLQRLKASSQTPRRTST